ncbi:hypothetical protein HH310_20480 [Actinoplanes sp. TBRC 11911]|uniref:hypothetical protein n=1 Tax=Actinoplanes sp. TBRC 11911 TaxID=2729386 RepID=UPI00145E1BD4|nr:hypothetical protein [Actinoplanes sp. TBRC 11911]NMO53549.1 hypothetical protein [Actinoplanes sp. TBRC 11911]
MPASRRRPGWRRTVAAGILTLAVTLAGLPTGGPAVAAEPRPSVAGEATWSAGA